MQDKLELNKHQITRLKLIQNRAFKEHGINIPIQYLLDDSISQLCDDLELEPLEVYLKATGWIK